MSLALWHGMIKLIGETADKLHELLGKADIRSSIILSGIFSWPAIAHALSP
jgi:hypothetical protein